MMDKRVDKSHNIGNGQVVYAAGGVLWRWATHKHSVGIEVLIIHRERYDDWSFPKGKLKEYESPKEAAIREIFEETGLQVALGEPLGITEYELPNGKLKRVWYWESLLDADAVVSQDHLDSQNEVTGTRWIQPGHAIEILSYKTERELVQKLLTRHNIADDL